MLSLHPVFKLFQRKLLLSYSKEFTMVGIQRITENGVLVKANAVFGKNKIFSMNYFSGRCFVHLMNTGGPKGLKLFSMPLDEFRDMLRFCHDFALEQFEKEFWEQVGLYYLCFFRPLYNIKEFCMVQLTVNNFYVFIRGYL